jgi:ribosomal protein L7/L12
MEASEAARIDALERRVATLEQQVIELSGRTAGTAGALQTGFEPEALGEQGSTDEVRALMAEGKKIDAIKLVRERTGLGLADAKEFVERL